MKRSIGRRSALLAGLGASLLCLAFAELDPNVPNIFNANESIFQNQTHFLVFTGADTAGENATTAKAYYKAVDPNNTKPTFQQWLVNAGFIGDASQWHPTGAQLIACDLPGCDLPSHQPDGSLTYGDNVINTDSHAIVLNAADLGFVRNQFIRCKPSCSAANPIIYTYLENYPVNPFAASGNGGSGFPINTGYPRDAEAKAAIESALNRPLGDLATCDPAKTDTVFKCSIQRIADVAFEWAPSASTPSSSTRYGQLYAYIFSVNSATGETAETLSIPPAGFAPNLVGQTAANVATRTLDTVNAGDPFPPNLDFIGFKQHPGVCFICHGGNPKNLTSTGAYPNQGKVAGFRFLPLDIRNLLFTSDSGAEQPAFPNSSAFTDRANQELQIKAYNLAVLKTVPSGAGTDEQGGTRVAHLREAIAGWYTDAGGPPFGRATQNGEFIPVGWREPASGGAAPAGSEQLYKAVVGPSCRSCHFNRELTLDFGTVRNFDAYRQDILELTLLPFCQAKNPPAGKRPMALAHLTYQRFWEANVSPQVLPAGVNGPLTIQNTADQLATHFGFSNTAGYCASRR